MILEYALTLVREDVMTREHRLYPITRLEKYTEPSNVAGLGHGGPMATVYAVILRAEFVPVGCVSDADKGANPVRDIYFKVLSRGVGNVPGGLLGFPVLDVEPFGMGHRVADATHYFSELDIHLPRGELSRRAEQHREVCDWIKKRGWPVLLLSRGTVRPAHRQRACFRS